MTPWGPVQTLVDRVRVDRAQRDRLDQLRRDAHRALDASPLIRPDRDPLRATSVSVAEEMQRGRIVHPNCRCVSTPPGSGHAWVGVDPGDPAGDRTAAISMTLAIVHLTCPSRAGIVVRWHSTATWRCSACDYEWSDLALQSCRSFSDLGLSEQRVPTIWAERAARDVTERTRPRQPEDHLDLARRRSARVRLGDEIPDHAEPLAPRRAGLPIYRPR